MSEQGPPPPDWLPLLPGFREMALRRMSAERRALVRELTAQRQSAGLSQTEVAARMGTSQSAVARLESGDADARASTLERYAAAVGGHISWQLHAAAPSASDWPVADSRVADSRVADSRVASDPAAMLARPSVPGQPGGPGLSAAAGPPAAPGQAPAPGQAADRRQP
jgi:transcriptional regulator with XRE-family HTH domain